MKHFANRKYARKINAALPAGYTVEPGIGKRHPRILRPDGKPLRSPDGRPVVVSGTPRTDNVDGVLQQVRRAIDAA